MTLLTPRANTSINSSILLRFNDASIKCTERSQGINYPIRGVQVPDALIQPVAEHVAETNPIVLSLHALDDQQVSPTALLLHASNHFVRSMLATPCTPDVVAQAPASSSSSSRAVTAELSWNFRVMSAQVEAGELWKVHAAGRAIINPLEQQKGRQNICVSS